MNRSEKVEKMFSSIAPRYDAANFVLSFGVYKLWYRKLMKLAKLRAGMKILDCATGTGNLAIKFKKILKENCEVTGVDFTENMLVIAREKAEKENLDIRFLREDMLDMSFPENSFDLITVAYGIRNVVSVEKGLSEMARVLKPGGKVLILEFGQPKGFFKLIFNIYSKTIIPLAGKLITGNRQAYSYLQETSSKFPCREDFIDIMKETGFYKDCKYYSLSGGIAYIYEGIKK